MKFERSKKTDHGVFKKKKSRNRSIELQANVHALVGNIYSICYISTYST